MEAAANFPGYANIQINSPYPLISLNELQIVKQANAHATASYTGIISETAAGRYLEQSTATDQIEIIQTVDGNPGRPLFCGRVAELKVRVSHGVYYLAVTAVSHTEELDIKQRCRSFQDPKLSYAELIRQVLAAYDGAALIDRATRGALTGGLVLQYQETDWELILRLASHHQAVVIPDSTAAAPRFWLGLPEGNPVELDSTNYVVERDLAGFLASHANFAPDLTVAACTGYALDSDIYLEIGTPVRFQGRELRVAGLVAAIKAGVLRFQYFLLPEAGLRQDRSLNPRLSGIALKGRIIDRQNDRVKVHLAIDPDQPKESAAWFPYASIYTAEGHSGWYCLPELGDPVRLYLPNRNEANAIVQSAARKDSGSNPKLADANTRYFGNSHGQELQLDNTAVTLSAQNGVTLIKLDQNRGVELKSDHQLVLTSPKDLKLEAGGSLNIKAQAGIYLSAKGSSVILDGRTDFQGATVSIESTAPPLPEPEGSPTNEAAVQSTDRTETILDAVQLGLDVLGFVPVVGIFADLANAGVSAVRGDWLGAGLSLLAAVPIVGDLASGGKLAQKGLAVAKKMPRLTKVAKAGLAGYMGYSAVTGAVAAGGHISQGDYLKAGRAIVNAIGVGRALKSNPPDWADCRRKMNVANSKKTAITRRKTGKCYRRNTQSHHCQGDPVDAVTGEVLVDRQDFFLAGRIPLAWDRHYGSQSTYQGSLGRGWESPADIRLEFPDDGTVLFHDGSGAPSCFKSLPEETPLVEPVDGRELAQEAGFYTVRLKTGLTYYFPVPQDSQEARPVLVDHLSDTSGNTIHYYRDAQGLREIKDSSGRRILVQSRQGRIETMQLHQPGSAGQLLVRYKYDADGNLTTVTDTLGQPYCFEYRDNRLVRHTNRNGLSFYYEYDRYTPNGRCIHMIAGPTWYS